MRSAWSCAAIWCRHFSSPRPGACPCPCPCHSRVRICRLRAFALLSTAASAQSDFGKFTESVTMKMQMPGATGTCLRIRLRRTCAPPGIMTCAPYCSNARTHRQQLPAGRRCRQLSPGLWWGSAEDDRRGLDRCGKLQVIRDALRRWQSATLHQSPTDIAVSDGPGLALPRRMEGKHGSWADRPFH